MIENRVKNRSSNKDTVTAIIFALLAAIFYALNIPLSKYLLTDISPTFMASFLYLGAGIGIGIIYVFRWKKADKSENLTKKDLPYTIGMIVLDIIAPILLMYGLKIGSSSSASLLTNFEIVVTSLIALFVFKEKITPKLWIAIALITLASGLLSFEGFDTFNFSEGSFLVILATCCWGVENNFTRKISNKSTYQIVTLKGLFSGLGAFIFALIIGEKLPNILFIALALLLGFVSYGLSIFLYVRAQRTLGASKTSACYAVTPFIGTLLSLLINQESFKLNYIFAFATMIIGAFFLVIDSLNISKKVHKELHVNGGA